MLQKIFNFSPVPPDETVTSWFPASAVRIGLEYRRLTKDGVKKSMVERPEIVEAILSKEITPAEGWSVHVCGADDGHEYLRFDCFDEDPHYHYIHRTAANEPPVNHVYCFDPTADGPMWAWAKQRIRSRLPDMLRQAKGGHLVGALEIAAVDQALHAIDDKIASLQADPELA
jgi:hypothetical protein